MAHQWRGVIGEYADRLPMLTDAPVITLHEGGTYVCIEGPQFSSLAESNWYRSMDGGVIGMTNMPEA